MKVVYHERYRAIYSSDPAAEAGRMESIYNVLQGNFEFVKPEPAKEEDLVLVHGKSHVEYVKANPLLYEIASLAVGGALKASEIALNGEPALRVDSTAGASRRPKLKLGLLLF